MFPFQSTDRLLIDFEQKLNDAPNDNKEKPKPMETDENEKETQAASSQVPKAIGFNIDGLPPPQVEEIPGIGPVSYVSSHRCTVHPLVVRPASITAWCT